VLVLSQPLISYPGGFENTRLPFFRQFREQLLVALRRCRVDLVVVAGDVHFGRLAVTTLNPALGTRLIEIVASPLGLVSDVAAAVGKKHDAPRNFPPFGPPAERTPVDYVHFAETYEVPRIWSRPGVRSEEHGMLLAFHRGAGGRVELRVRPRYVRGDTSARAFSWETSLSGAAQVRLSSDRPVAMSG